MWERSFVWIRRFLIAAAVVCVASPVGAGTPTPHYIRYVPLRNGTATFSMLAYNGPYGAGQAVDGDFGANNGWTIWEDGAAIPNVCRPQTAVWETESDQNASGLTFTLYFLHFTPRHLLGRFRFSVTADDRNEFADGRHGNGDVEARWTVLQNPRVQGPKELTFQVLPDHSVLATGKAPRNGVYVVRYESEVRGITGIRLEVMEHPSLPPGFGPGIAADNENFFLNELVLTAEPPAPSPSSRPLSPGLPLLIPTMLIRKRRR